MRGHLHALLGHSPVAWADGETVPYGHEHTPEAFVRHATELLFRLRRALTPTASVWWGPGRRLQHAHADSSQRVRSAGCNGRQGPARLE